MAAVTSVTSSLTDATRKEDGVLGLIELLSPVENYAFNTFRRTVARDMVHFWHDDTLNAVATRAAEEGADYTYVARTTPNRRQNLVQGIVWPFRVTFEAIAIETWVGQNQLAYQTAKNMKDFANSVEYDLWRSTLVSAVDGTAAKLSGIIQIASDGGNHTSHDSGTVLNASHIRGLMRENYDNGNGEMATDLFVSSFSRALIDSFITKTNVILNASDVTKITERVSVFETSFGTLRLITHRYMEISTDATGRLMALRPEKFAIAYLESPFIQENLSVAGGYVPRALRTSLTLECSNKLVNWFADGFDKD